MGFLPPRLKHVMKAANVATVATSVITGMLGSQQGKNGKGGKKSSPLDAVTQVLFGGGKPSKPDANEDVVGAGLHAGAMYAWSALYEGVFGKWVRRGDALGAKVGRAAFAGAVVSGAAYVTDQYLLPKPMTPGTDDEKLSSVALATTYGVLAAALAAGALWAARDEAAA